jgi:hypothetical protein
MTDDESEASANWQTSWIRAEEPISFSLSTEGELLVEYGVRFEIEGPVRTMGLVIPAERARTLLHGLRQTGTIQETLSAKRPIPGAH